MKVLGAVADAVVRAARAVADAMQSFFAWIGEYFANVIRAAVEFLVASLQADMRQLAVLAQGAATGPATPGLLPALILLPLASLLWSVKQKLEDTLTVMETTEVTISTVLTATGLGGIVKTILSKITIEAIKKALQRVVISLTVGAIVQELAGLADRDAIDSFAGKIFGAAAGVSGLVLATLEIFKKLAEQTPSVPRSRYAIGAGWAVLGLAVQLLAIPLLSDVLGTSHGIPLLLLDAFSGGIEIVALLMMGGKKVFKAGVLSAFIDKLIEVFGPITSGIEQLLTGVSATATFVSIGTHVVSGDYWR